MGWRQQWKAARKRAALDETFFLVVGVILLPLLILAVLIYQDWTPFAALAIAVLVCAMALAAWIWTLQTGRTGYQPTLSRWERIAALAAGASLVGLVLLVRWIAPQTASERNSLAQTMAQVVGGFGLVGSLYLTSKTVRASQATLELSQQSQATDRYYKALEYLASEKAGVRVGALYALERLSHDSERDYQMVVDVIVGFMRDHASVEVAREWGMEYPVDLQVALTVLGRRRVKKGERRLALYDLDLSHAHLHGDFSLADFHGSDLTGADLKSGSFVNADFTGASLKRADLRLANFLRADMQHANLNLASFNDPTVHGRDPETLTFETWAPTEDRLVGLDLKGAFMLHTQITACDLSRAIGLTQEQIDTAITDNRTILPDGLKPSRVRRNNDLVVEQESH